MAKLPPNLEVVLHHIEEHFAQEMKLGDLAKLAGLHEVCLERLFKKTLGATPRGYLSEVRVLKAKTILMDPTGTIQEVARLVGIPDPYYFSRPFRRFEGIAPKQFRSAAVHPDGVRLPAAPRRKAKPCPLYQGYVWLISSRYCLAAPFSEGAWQAYTSIRQFGADPGGPRLRPSGQRSRTMRPDSSRVSHHSPSGHRRARSFTLGFRILAGTILVAADSPLSLQTLHYGAREIELDANAGGLRRLAWEGAELYAHGNASPSSRLRIGGERMPQVAPQSYRKILGSKQEDSRGNNKEKTRRRCA